MGPSGVHGIFHLYGSQRHKKNNGPKCWVIKIPYFDQWYFGEISDMNTGFLIKILMNTGFHIRNLVR